MKNFKIFEIFFAFLPKFQIILDIINSVYYKNFQILFKPNIINVKNLSSKNFLGFKKKLVKFIFTKLDEKTPFA